MEILNKLKNGEYSLVKTYWLFGVVGNLCGKNFAGVLAFGTCLCLFIPSVSSLSSVELVSMHHIHVLV